MKKTDEELIDGVLEMWKMLDEPKLDYQRFNELLETFLPNVVVPRMVGGADQSTAKHE